MAGLDEEASPARHHAEAGEQHARHQSHPQSRDGPPESYHRHRRARQPPQTPANPQQPETAVAERVVSYWDSREDLRVNDASQQC